MKTLIGLLIVMICSCAQSQTHQEKITKDLTFEKESSENTIIVANIFGNITVEGYSGKSVLLEVDKTIYGKTQERLDKGKETIKLGIVDRADTLIFYTQGLCSQFGKHGNNNIESAGWGYRWNDCDHSNLEFDYKMNYKIKVPAGINVIVSTVNDGDIKVEKVSGAIVANNVNGDITLNEMIQAVKAHTINGDVDVNYIKHPMKECKFYTLNGNIHANFPKKGLAANVNFKSFNGEFFTNLAKLDNLPVQVDKQPSSKGTKYSVNGNRFKAGNGGALLDFETFNGNVYLKEVE